MRRVINFTGALLAIVFAGTLGTLYLTRESRPVITCLARDSNIRPRTRCLMNPFRDRTMEDEAEVVLRSLQAGDTGTLVPFIADANEDHRNRYLGNETKYRIKSWQLGGWSVEGSESYLTYWVTRENYEWEEEVTFHMKRAGEDWKVIEYSAIY